MDSIKGSWLSKMNLDNGQKDASTARYTEIGEHTKCIRCFRHLKKLILTKFNQVYSLINKINDLTLKMWENVVCVVM